MRTVGFMLIFLLLSPMALGATFQYVSYDYASDSFFRLKYIEQSTIIDVPLNSEGMGTLIFGGDSYGIKRLRNNTAAGVQLQVDADRDGSYEKTLERGAVFTTSESDGTISVTVYEEGTAIPIRYAVVHLKGAEFSDDWTADQDGRVSEEGIPAGSYTISASAEGFADASKDISVEASKTMEIELPMRKTGDETHPVSEDDLSIEFPGVGEQLSRTEVTVYDGDYSYVDGIDGPGISGARITVLKNEKVQWDWILTDSNGRASMVLGTGAYVLKVQDTEKNWAAREFAVTVPAEDKQPRIKVGLHKLTDDTVPVYVPEGYTYISVVGTTGSANDVVVAANFAAHMKSLYGISFIGMTNEELAEKLKLNPLDLRDFLDSAFIVRIAGDRYAIMEGSAALQKVTRETESYLGSQGLSRFGGHLTRGALIDQWLLPELDGEGYIVEVVDGESIVLPEPAGGELACPSGCFKDAKCIPYGLRTKNGAATYCDLSGAFLEQKPDGEACQNDYECVSNSCASGACIDLTRELRETRNMLQVVLDWLKALL